MRHLVFIPNAPCKEVDTTLEFCEYPVGTYRYTFFENCWGIIRYDVPNEWRCVPKMDVPNSIMNKRKSYLLK